MGVTDVRIYYFCRFFTDYTKPYHNYLIILWIIVWKWVDPIVMFVIFIASVILEIVRPLTYTVYQNVSKCRIFVHLIQVHGTNLALTLQK